MKKLWRKLGSPSNLHLIQVDTSSNESIDLAKNQIKRKFSGQLDVIINNTGIASIEKILDKSQQMLLTNYCGVNVASELGV